jgi:hypothetical protein
VQTSKGDAEIPPPQSDPLQEMEKVQGRGSRSTSADYRLLYFAILIIYEDVRDPFASNHGARVSLPGRPSARPDTSGQRVLHNRARAQICISLYPHSSLTQNIAPTRSGGHIPDTYGRSNTVIPASRAFIVQSTIEATLAFLACLLMHRPAPCRSCRSCLAPQPSGRAAFPDSRYFPFLTGP